MADSTYSTSLPDSYRCVYWMAGLETESHQALPGHKRSLAHCEHLSVLAHEKKKPSRAPDVALCLMQGHTLNITFVML